MIRKATIGDAASIAAIYNHYVDHTIVTFAETHTTAADIEELLQEAFPFYVYEEGEDIFGYAHASRFKSRCAYRTSVEVTVYLHPEHCNKGIGSGLYQQLIQDLDKADYHAIIAGISLPNEASVALHEKFGFEKVAHFKEVGYKFGKYIDVGYWQRIR